MACIVNDVAAVNIDAKLIRGDAARDPNSTTADLTDTIELANGCACESGLVSLTGGMCCLVKVQCSADHSLGTAQAAALPMS